MKKTRKMKEEKADKSLQVCFEKLMVGFRLTLWDGRRKPDA